MSFLLGEFTLKRLLAASVLVACSAIMVSAGGGMSVLIASAVWPDFLSKVAIRFAVIELPFGLLSG